MNATQQPTRYYRRFVYGNTPRALPLTDADEATLPDGFDYEAEQDAAGFGTWGDEVTVTTLAEQWGEYPAGSVVWTGQQVEGWPFAVEVPGEEGRYWSREQSA